MQHGMLNTLGSCSKCWQLLHLTPNRPPQPGPNLKSQPNHVPHPHAQPWRTHPQAQPRLSSPCRFPQLRYNSVTPCKLDCGLSAFHAGVHWKHFVVAKQLCDVLLILSKHVCRQGEQSSWGKVWGVRCRMGVWTRSSSKGTCHFHHAQWPSACCVGTMRPSVHTGCAHVHYVQCGRGLGQHMRDVRVRVHYPPL